MVCEPLELWGKYIEKKGPDLKEQLAIHYSPLVHRIANKVISALPDHFVKEDLYSYGVLGLLEAIDRFNPQLGVAFPAFAVKRIKGAIIDGVRKEDWVPTSIRRKAKLIEEAYLKLELELKRCATDHEIAEELNISVEELNQWLKSVRFITIISLDECLDEDGSVLIRDSIPDRDSPNPQQLYEENELKELLVQAVNELPDKERQVVSLFYYHDLTNKEIAEVLQLSDSRISQLHSKAVLRLRGRLARTKKNYI